MTVAGQKKSLQENWFETIFHSSGYVTKAFSYLKGRKVRVYKFSRQKFSRKLIFANFANLKKIREIRENLFSRNFLKSSRSRNSRKKVFAKFKKSVFHEIREIVFAQKFQCLKIFNPKIFAKTDSGPKLGSKYYDQS